MCREERDDRSQLNTSWLKGCGCRTINLFGYKWIKEKGNRRHPKRTNVLGQRDSARSMLLGVRPVPCWVPVGGRVVAFVEVARDERPV
jgi:hypothetical protein